MWLVAEGTIVILFSILSGAVIGFYLPILSKVFCIVYAVLAFWLPRTKAQRTLFVTSAVMFLIFASLPFNFHQGLSNAIYGLLIVPLILLFYGLFDFHIYSETLAANKSKTENQIIPAYIAGVALSGESDTFILDWVDGVSDHTRITWKNN